MSNVERNTFLDSQAVVACGKALEGLADRRWTHKEVGGWYEVLLVATGAGKHKGDKVVIYKRVATYDVFTRPLDDFLERMIPAIESPAPKHWQDD